MSSQTKNLQQTTLHASDQGGQGQPRKWRFGNREKILRHHNAHQKTSEEKLNLS